MTKLTHITTSGKKGNLTVSDEVFGAKVNQVLLSQAARVYLSNRRQATSAVKTRADVARTKKKWFKQKGTGNARHGARSAHIFVGGGVAHGPKANQNWQKDLSQTLKHKALVSALSAQVQNSLVIDSLEDLAGKTQEAVQVLKPISSSKDKILVVLPSLLSKSIRALGNIENVLTVQVNELTALEVMMANKIVFTSSAVKALTERLLNKRSKSPKVKVASESKSKKTEVVKPIIKKPVTKSVTKKAVAKSTAKKSTKKVK